MNNQGCLEIKKRAWEGFQGMFVYYNQIEVLGYYYKINGSYYDAFDLSKKEDDIDKKSYHSGLDRIQSFKINTNGSKILIITVEGEELLYQFSNGEFKQLLSEIEHDDNDLCELEECPYTIKVPLPNGKDVNGIFEELKLSEIDNIFIKNLGEYLYDREINLQRKFSKSDLVNILNEVYKTYK